MNPSARYANAAAFSLMGSLKESHVSCFSFSLNPSLLICRGILMEVAQFLDQRISRTGATVWIVETFQLELCGSPGLSTIELNSTRKSNCDTCFIVKYQFTRFNPVLISWNIEIEINISDWTQALWVIQKILWRISNDSSSACWMMMN